MTWSLAKSLRAACAVLVVALSMLSPAAPESEALPEYRPRQSPGGTIRISGNDRMAPLLKRWQEGFRKFHPRVQFSAALDGTGSGIYGLEMRNADIALMGRAMNPFERYGTYERAWVFPVEIEVATGSFSTPHQSPAFAIFVHSSNPLAQLSIGQLDGIFGAQRGGGWNGLSWIESAARPASADIRTWGQLGVGGEWANKPLHVYGPALQGAGVTTFFQARVLKGGDLWNEDLREYVDRGQMIADLGKDPLGIAYAPLAYRTPGVKAVALAETPAGPFVPLTRTSVADRSYPLARPVYIAYTIDDERSEIAEPRVDPRVEEFLRYVLSRQGQADVTREGSYLPLTPAVVREQLKKLHSRDTPPERRLLTASAAPSRALRRIRMTLDENPIVPQLAASLGYLAEEGIEIEAVDINALSAHDFLLQQPLIDGRIDAAYHWFHHAVFGARHRLPIQAVMLFNDAPGMTVLVASRVRSEIRSAADFRGRTVAEGAGYGTKSLITGYLASRAGLPPRSYTPVMAESAGRQDAVLRGLREGSVEVMTFQEPMTSALLASQLAIPLYDLNRRESTVKAFGAPWPAQSLLVAPRLIEKDPETVQRLVNAFVRTMRFVNTHRAEEIATRLPPAYFAAKDRDAEIALIRSTLPSYARDDYSLDPAGVRLVVEAIESSPFDRSEAGKWRSGVETPRIDPDALYDNRFVERAMLDHP